MPSVGRNSYTAKSRNDMTERIEQIRKEAADIQSQLESIDGGDINEQLDLLDVYGVYYARSGQLLAEVSGIKDAMMAKTFHNERETIMSLSPSLATKLVNSSAHEYSALEKWLDRINAACKVKCEGLRTKISFEKERMRL